MRLSLRLILFLGGRDHVWSPSSYRGTRFARRSAACAPTFSAAPKFLPRAFRRLSNPLYRELTAAAASHRRTLRQQAATCRRGHLRQARQGACRKLHAGYSPDASASPARPDEIQSGWRLGGFLTLGGNPMHAYYMPLHQDGDFAGVLAIFHDASYIEAQSDRIWRDTVWHVIAQVLLIVFITVLIIRWTVILPISRTAQWMKDIRGGRVGPRPKIPNEDFLAPFSQEVVNLAKSLSEARASAEEEARLRETGESMWTAERLRVSIQSRRSVPCSSFQTASPT